MGRSRKERRMGGSRKKRRMGRLRLRLGEIAYKSMSGISGAEGESIHERAIMNLYYAVYHYHWTRSNASRQSISPIT